MITEKDLQEAIAECQGTRNPNSSTCIKLASFLTIQDHLFGKKEESTMLNKSEYSFASEPKPKEVIGYSSDTEFAQLINGREPNEVWKIIDELMSVLQAINPRLYNGVLRKIES